MKNSFTVILIVFNFSLSAQTKTVYLDPSSAISTSVSQLFSKVNFIPLETTKQSTISYIGGMVVTDQFIIIRDPANAAILFFDKSGKFLSKYVDKGNEIRSLIFNKHTNSIFIQTMKKGYSLTDKERFEFEIGSRHAVNYFGLYECNLSNKDSFQFVQVLNFKYGAYNLRPFANGSFLASLFLADLGFPDEEGYELNVVKDNHIVKKFFPYNLKRYSPYFLHLRKVGYFDSPDNGKVYFTRPYHYEIYSFEDDKVTVALRFVFPLSRSLPQNFFEQDLSTETNFEVLKKKYQGAIEEIIPLSSQRNYLAFWLSTLQPNNVLDKKLYLLELSSNTLVYARRIYPDSLSYHLPVNLDWCKYGNESGLYSFISSYDLLNAARNFSTDKVNMPQELNFFLEKNNPKGNPVIIQVQ